MSNKWGRQLMAKRRVERTRNAGTWTEAQYWGFLRSSLRRAFRYYKPLAQCKINARRKYKGKRKSQKWEYQCAECKEWFKGKDVQVDHVVPVGSLKCYEDLAGFVKRLTAEREEDYQLMCKKCHQIKTNKERGR